MAKTFDFNKIKEKTMNVVLSDEAKTLLILKTPNKALMESLQNIQDEIRHSEDEDELIESLYDVTAKIMSRNKNEKVITSELLKELYPDIDFILEFITAYMEFIDEYTNASKSKN